jgi:hypothetical protein
VPTFILPNTATVPHEYTSPNVCPFCHHHSTFDRAAHFASGTGKFYAVLRCPNDSCHEVFIAVYHATNGRHLNFAYIDGGKIKYKTFSDAILDISSTFIEIHRQAQAAEFYGLDQIAGVGFRKALEFLIKDYAKKLSPHDSKHIEAIQLSPVIEKYIDNSRIKEMAKRAAWLGNDETHYVRKWVEADINDLKALITLVVHFIESEELYTKTIAAMPEGKK